MELDVEKKRRAEEVTRLKDEVILLQIEAKRKGQTEKTRKGWADSELRLADEYSGE